jgi:outer membrane protein TolC
MKKIFTLFCFFLSITFFCQEETIFQKQITLEEAIKIAQENSPDYKALLNQNQANYWRYRRFRAGFLPQLRFDATLPQYRYQTNFVIASTAWQIPSKQYNIAHGNGCDVPCFKR